MRTGASRALLAFLALKLGERLTEERRADLSALRLCKRCAMRDSRTVERRPVRFGRAALRVAGTAGQGKIQLNERVSEKEPTLLGTQAGFEHGGVVVAVTLPAFLLSEFFGEMLDEPIDVCRGGIGFEFGFGDFE